VVQPALNYLPRTFSNVFVLEHEEVPVKYGGCYFAIVDVRDDSQPEGDTLSDWQPMQVRENE